MRTPRPPAVAPREGDDGAAVSGDQGAIGGGQVTGAGDGGLADRHHASAVELGFLSAAVGVFSRREKMKEC